MSTTPTMLKEQKTTKYSQWQLYSSHAFCAQYCRVAWTSGLLGGRHEDYRPIKKGLTFHRPSPLANLVRHTSTLYVKKRFNTVMKTAHTGTLTLYRAQTTWHHSNRRDTQRLLVDNPSSPVSTTINIVAHSGCLYITVQKISLCLL